MKKLLPMLVALLALAGTSTAQNIVDLYHYKAGPNYFIFPLPAGSLALARFELQYPAKVHEINFWPLPIDTLNSDSVTVLIYGREGGGPFPVLLQPLFSKTIFLQRNSIDPVHVQLPSPVLEFDQPTVFFVGVKLGTTMKVRLDAETQVPTCVTSERDSLWTSSYWLDLPSNYIPFYATVTTGGQLKAMTNWFIGAKVEYLNQPPSTLFKDVTVSSKLFVPPSGKRLAWADYDNDGWQDLLYGKYLFRNRTDGTFSDVSDITGFNQSSEVQMFVDLDNNGKLDIVSQPTALTYLNTGAVFSKNIDPGFSPGINTQAMTFADYDADGYPEMFVAHGEYRYMKNGSDSALVTGVAWPAFFYANLQNGSFRDITTLVLGGYRAGKYGELPFTPKDTSGTEVLKIGYRPIKAAEFVDIDDDGDLDLYAGNDRFQPNYLFEDQGTSFYRETSMLHGLQGGVKTQYPGMYGCTRGANFGDYDNDGDVDLLAGEMTDLMFPQKGDLSAIWANGGKPAAAFSMVPNTTSHFTFDIWNADVAWGDYNNDGLLDAAVTSGEQCSYARIYQQNADHSFTETTFSAGLDAENSLGVTWVDYDNDGDLDLCLAAESGIKLYRNDTPNKGNWVEVNLLARTTNKFGIGARVRAYAGGQIYTRWVIAGKGAGSQQPYVQHIGIGTATSVDSLQVRWPNGTFFTLKNPEINKMHNIVEPEPVAADDIPAPSALALGQNYPNPVTPSADVTRIAYNLPVAGDVTIEIFDATGARIRTLVHSAQQAGLHTAQWDGRDEQGRLAASGSYHYVLTAGERTLTRALVITR